MSLSRMGAALISILESHPEIAMQLVDGDASKLSFGSNKKMEWRCQYDHPSWIASVQRRTRGDGCPYCSGRLPVVGVNDLATLNPIVASELLDQSLGTQLTQYSGRSVMWLCSSGHIWEAKVFTRTHGHGCQQCHLQKLAAVVGVSDLATTHPDLAAELKEKSLATRLTKGQRLSVDWVCENGHEWTASVCSRSRGHGCPECSVSGYHNDSDGARLYLILPPGNHPIGYGKTHSEYRYDHAMSHAYSGCKPLAYASGSGSSVTDAENELRSMAGTPVGKIKRIRREALERSMDSIDIWEAAALNHGLEITWIIDRESIVLGRPVVTRVHSPRTHCGCTDDGLGRHDSMNRCCTSARSESDSIIADSHYLHRAATGTVHCFTWNQNGKIAAIMNLGTGSGPRGASSLTTYSGIVGLEITRLWASPELEISLSSFVSRCLNAIKYPAFIFSYADSAEGHTGGIYRACSFNYAGWSDMDRARPLRRKRDDRTPFCDWPEISAKHRYWKLIGVKGKRRADALEAAGWPCFDAALLGFSPILGHRRVRQKESSRFLRTCT